MIPFALSIVLALIADGQHPKYTWVWACPHGPAELVQWIVEHGEELDWETFNSVVDIGTLPPRRVHKGPKIWSSSIGNAWSHLEAAPPGFSPEDIEDFPTMSSATFWQTTLPSGRTAFFLVHSGVEYLFVDAETDIGFEQAVVVA